MAGQTHCHRPHSHAHAHSHVNPAKGVEAEQAGDVAEEEGEVETHRRRRRRLHHRVDSRLGLSRRLAGRLSQLVVAVGLLPVPTLQNGNSLIAPLATVPLRH